MLRIEVTSNCSTAASSQSGVIWPRRCLDALPTLDNSTHTPLTVSALVAECRLNGVHYPLTGARTTPETVVPCSQLSADRSTFRTPRRVSGWSPSGGVTMTNNVAQTKG